MPKLHLFRVGTNFISSIPQVIRERPGAGGSHILGMNPMSDRFEPQSHTEYGIISPGERAQWAATQFGEVSPPSSAARDGAVVFSPPNAPDEFERAIRTWLPYVHLRFRPLVTTWETAFRRAAAVPVSAASLKKLCGMMRRDVEQHADILWNAEAALISAWIKFHPVWVERLIAERANLDPFFLLPAADYEREKKAKRARDDTAQKQAKRDRELVVRLFKYCEAHDWNVAWAPHALARAISSKRGGPRIKPEQIRDAADTLVRLDIAKWRMRANGQPWALQLEQRSFTLN